MKKLLVILVALVLVGCAPSEATAEEIQAWYDECELIESCSDKIEELREQGLDESVIVDEMQIQLNDHEARIKALEDRVFNVEERTVLVETLLTGPSNTFTLLDNYGYIDAIWIQQNDKDGVEIWINSEAIFWDNPNVVPANVRAAIGEAILLDLSGAVYPDEVEINMIYIDGETLTITLKELQDR
jgi:hypothetical protein